MSATALACLQCRRPEYPLRRHLCHACYERGRRAGTIVSGRVDATTARHHIALLRESGWGMRAIAREAGFSRPLLWHIVNGRDVILAKTRDALLALQPGDPNGLKRHAWSNGARWPAGHRSRILATTVCGDCEHHPCRCPRVDDADVPLLGHLEGGHPDVRQRTA